MNKVVKDDVTKMGMHDLALNQYFVKHGWAYHRNYEREIECRLLIREVAKTLCIEALENISEEEFGELMLDWSQFDETSKEGILAMFYNSMWGMAELRERLKECEKNMDDFDIEVFECASCKTIQAHQCYRFLRKDGDYDCSTTCEGCGHESSFTLRAEDPENTGYE